MSWFDFTSFRRKQYQEPPPPNTPSGEEPPPVSEEGKKWLGFDPTGLERAAKAARELDKSRMHILEHECAKYKPISFSRSYFSQSPCFRAFCTTIVFQTYMPPINILVANVFIYLY